MIRRVLLSLIVVAIAAVLLLALWPQLVGLQAAPVIAQVVSLRGLDVAIALALVAVVGLGALAWRRARRFLGAIVLLLVVFSLANAAILAARGFGGTSAASHPVSSITVLSWNTKGGAPGAERIAKLALAEHADVVVLPETTQNTGITVSTMMKSAGRPMWVLSAAHGYVYQSHATTLLVSAALGRYTVDPTVGDTSVLSSLVARPDVGTAGPTIIAVHAVSPKPQEMRNWRSDLNYLSTLCTGRNVIMAGDFNATTDDLGPLSSAGADFGRCRDAGLASGGGATGTWPTNLPVLLGAQIDHVMFGPAWKVSAMRVIGTEDNSGSDHRPILVTLSPAS